MKFYRKLTVEEITAILSSHHGGYPLYITFDEAALKRRPMLAERHGSIGIRYSNGGPTLLFSKYDDEWYAEVEDGFTVDTPDGVLHIHDKRDADYPGVYVDLYRPDCEHPITLSMTEYIPGGEGLCGWDPRCPGKSWEELDEVPVQRIVHEDNTPVFIKDLISLPDCKENGKECVITAGFVTRGWPDERHDEETHERIFHFGYKDASEEEAQK